MSFSEEYRKQLEAVRFSPDFALRAGAAMKPIEREKYTMNKKTLKIIIAVAAALMLSVTTAFAADYLLSSRDVAELIADSIGSDSIREAFASDDAIELGESIEDDGYRITLLGAASGSELHHIDGMDVDDRREYVAVAVERLDGQPLSAQDEQPFMLLMLIDGYEPWRLNSWSLGYGATRMDENGVLYFIFDCSDIELFADHTVYLTAYDGFAPGSEIFALDSEGHISYTEGYEGIRAMFTLPLDAGNADPAAAAELIHDLGIE